MSLPSKSLGIDRCLFLSVAVISFGCGQNSSPTPATSSTARTRQSTTITPVPAPSTLFNDHHAFLFEVSGSPAAFTLDTHWSQNPIGGDHPSDLLIFSGKRPQEHHKAATSQERGSVAVLFPKQTTGTVELHFRRGKTLGTAVIEQLQDLLPEEAANMRITGSGAARSGSPKETSSIQVATNSPRSIFTYYQKFENDSKTAYIVYTLTATSSENPPH